ncbi:MAG: hypothetical protein HKN19_17195, partial [Halioglobus sp.]|nr:hypothetical protein [Halioglobus sp.]
MNNASRLHGLIYDSPYSVVLCCLAYLVFSLLLFSISGLFEADAIEMGFDSREHLLGLILLMSLLPTWFIGCMFITQRNSFKIAKMLDADLAQRITAIPARYFWYGFLGGLVYALAFNVPIGHYRRVLEGDWAMAAIFLGQILVWVFSGWMLAVRLYVGNQFYRLGETIPINIFEQSRLQPFARVGLVDLVIILGGVAISTVQSIDAQFRLGNYLTAFIVAVPASVALLMRPMWTVHKRLLERKRALKAEVLAQLRAQAQTSDTASAESLERLLQRRDRIDALHT